MNENKRNNLISLGLSLLGFAFLLYYIFRASRDVVASDYIRIINFYLEDVSDLKFLLSWEGISRIPFTFLARYVNVNIFKYSVHFDRILGVVGLCAFNFVLVKYVLKTFKSKIVKTIASVVVSYISFSLMSWEMILNGTGYAHFWMIAIIVTVFYLFDKKVLLPVYILTAVGSLCFGGSYSVSFLCTLILFSIIEIIFSKKDLLKYFALILISLICLACYFKSNSTGEPLIPVGFQDISLMELLSKDPSFPIRFFLKSLASSIIGVETIDYAIAFNTINERIIFIIGLIYVLIILVTIFIIIKSIVSKKATDENAFDLSPHKNLFPFMLLVYGAANYALIFLARYPFVRDEYGMSSRYSIQYMFLTLGIILILLLYIDDIVFYNKIYTKDKKETGENKVSVPTAILFFISILSIGILFFGHITTTTDEIYKSDYRKIIYNELVEKAKNYDTLSDEELENYFEFRRGPEQIRQALSTLKSQHLNIFRE